MPHSVPPPMATLRLFSDGLEPDVVSQIMGVEPTAAAPVGGAIGRTAHGDAVKAKTGTWLLSTKDRVDAANPETHLRWLTSLVGAHWAELQTNVSGIRADFSILIHGDGLKIAQTLSRELVENATSFGELEIEIPAMDVNEVVDHSTYTRLFAHHAARFTG